MTNTRRDGDEHQGGPVRSSIFAHKARYLPFSGREARPGSSASEPEDSYREMSAASACRQHRADQHLLGSSLSVSMSDSATDTDESRYSQPWGSRCCTSATPEGGLAQPRGWPVLLGRPEGLTGHSAAA